MQDQYSRSLLRYFINLCTLTNSPSKSTLSLQPSFTVFHPFVSKRNLFFSKLLFPKTLFRPRERNKEARLFHRVFREKRWKGSLRTRRIRLAGAAASDPNRPLSHTRDKLADYTGRCSSKGQAEEGMSPRPSLWITRTRYSQHSLGYAWIVDLDRIESLEKASAFISCD